MSRWDKKGEDRDRRLERSERDRRRERGVRERSRGRRSPSPEYERRRRDRRSPDYKSDRYRRRSRSSRRRERSCSYTRRRSISPDRKRTSIVAFDGVKPETSVDCVVTSFCVTKKISPPNDCNYDALKSIAYIRFGSEYGLDAFLRAAAKAPVVGLSKPRECLAVTPPSRTCTDEQLKRSWCCVICGQTNVSIRFACVSCKADRVEDCTGPWEQEGTVPTPPRSDFGPLTLYSNVCPTIPSTLIGQTDVCYDPRTQLFLSVDTDLFYNASGDSFKDNRGILQYNSASSVKRNTSEDPLKNILDARTEPVKEAVVLPTTEESMSKRESSVNSFMLNISQLKNQSTTRKKETVAVQGSTVVKLEPPSSNIKKEKICFSTNSAKKLTPVNKVPVLSMFHNSESEEEAPVAPPPMRHAKPSHSVTPVPSQKKEKQLEDSSLVVNIVPCIQNPYVRIGEGLCSGCLIYFNNKKLYNDHLNKASHCAEFQVVFEKFHKAIIDF